MRREDGRIRILGRAGDVLNVRGAKIAVAVGFAIITAGLVVGAFTGVHTGYGYAAGWIAALGAGMGFVMPVAMGAAVNALEAERSGAGSAMMCRMSETVELVRTVVEAVCLPVTVKMRLGWDETQLTAPAFAREFEQVGVAAVAIHGRTRAQGFSGVVNRDGIRAVVEAVQTIPVIGNGDMRLRTTQGASLVDQSGEALRARDLLHEVAVDVEQDAAVSVGFDDVFFPDLVVKCARSHAEPAKKAYATKVSDRQVSRFERIWRRLQSLLLRGRAIQIYAAMYAYATAPRCGRLRVETGN